MKFLDLFAGIGGFRTGMEAAGHECIGFCEYDNYAVASYTSMYLITDEQREYLATLPLKKRQKEILKEEYRNGEWYEKDIRAVNARNVPRADIWCFGAPCFVGGALVTTAEGMKPIEDVRIGDMVLTHKSRFRKVTSTMKHLSDDIYAVKIQGSYKFMVTGNHRFYVRYRLKDGWSDPIWKPINQFSGHEYVIFPHNTEQRNTMDLTAEEAWLLGRYVADGYKQNYKRKDRPSNTKRVVWCVGCGKEKEFEKHLDGIKWHKSEDGSCSKYITTNKRMFELCKHCGQHAHEKRIPGFVMDLPADLLEEFIDGYMSGDGCFTNGKFKASSTSRELILQLAQCVIKVYGTSFAVYETSRPNTCVIEGRTVNQRSTYQLAFGKEPQKQDKGHYVDGEMWMPFKKMEKIRITLPVYNLEVEEDESYTVNLGGCHNCQDFSVAGQRKGLDGDRSSLVREVFRIIREIDEEDRPQWLIYENVKGMLSSNGGKDFLAILTEMDELGYDAEWSLFNSKDWGVPQNRERVYTVGHLRRYGPKEIFPLKGADGKNSVPIKWIAHSNNLRRYNETYDPSGIVECLDTGRWGGHNPYVPVEYP